MIRIGDFSLIIVDKSIVILGRKHRSKWWDVQCVGCKGKRRKDGSCKHERSVLDRLTPKIRQYARIKVEEPPP